MPSTGTGTIQSRQILETYLDPADQPTSDQLDNLIQSFIHRTEDHPVGDIRHDPMQLYDQGTVVVDNGQLYQCISEIDSAELSANGGSIAVTNTTYWQQIQTDLTIVDVADAQNPTEIQALDNADGVVIAARFTGETPTGGGIYVYDSAGQTQNVPYIIDSASGKSWVAVAGTFEQRVDAQSIVSQGTAEVIGKTTLQDDLDLNANQNTSGNQTTTGNGSFGGTLDVTGVTTLQSDVTAQSDHYVQGIRRDGGFSPGFELDPDNGQSSTTNFQLNKNNVFYQLEKNRNASYVLPALNDGQIIIVRIGDLPNTQFKAGNASFDTQSSDTFLDGSTSWSPANAREILFTYFGGTWYRYVLHEDTRAEWQDVATGPGFQNSWGNNSTLTNPQPLEFRLLNSDIVQIRGTIEKGSDVTTDEAIFTLPAGYRPSTVQYMIGTEQTGPVFRSVFFDPSNNTIRISSYNAGTKLHIFDQITL